MAVVNVDYSEFETLEESSKGIRRDRKREG